MPRQLSAMVACVVFGCCRFSEHVSGCSCCTPHCNCRSPRHDAAAGRVTELLTAAGCKVMQWLVMAMMLNDQCPCEHDCRLIWGIHMHCRHLNSHPISEQPRKPRARSDNGIAYNIGVASLSCCLQRISSSKIVHVPVLHHCCMPTYTAGMPIYS